MKIHFYIYTIFQRYNESHESGPATYHDTCLEIDVPIYEIHHMKFWRPHSVHLTLKAAKDVIAGKLNQFGGQYDPATNISKHDFPDWKIYKSDMSLNLMSNWEWSGMFGWDYYFEEVEID